MRAAAAHPSPLLLRCIRRSSILIAATPLLLPLPLPAPIQPLSSSSSSSSPAAKAGATALDAPSDAPSPKDAADAFRLCGCTEPEVAQILARHAALARMKPPLLHSKLEALRAIGLTTADLVRMVTLRPRFLSSRVGPGLAPRLDFLRSTLFPSPDSATLLRRAIVRNPSLLAYDVDRTLRPCVALYQSLGVDPAALGRLVICRPTIIPRSSLDPEKLELLRRTGLSPGDTMYKYAASVLAVSRLETIRAKVANLEKFGFSTDEVMVLFARVPNLLTLSVEKVQRNMTYLVGTMRLPPSVVMEEPKVLQCNLDKVLRPRHLVWTRLQEMGLQPKIKEPSVPRVVRMPELRFLDVFVRCHGSKAERELLEYYEKVKELRRLAESSRSTKSKGFPF